MAKVMAKRGLAVSRPASQLKRIHPHGSATNSAEIFYAGQKFIGGEPRVLYLDYETTPEAILCFGGIYEVNAIKMLKNTHVASVAWRWGHEEKTHVKSWRHFKGYKRPKDIWEALRDMDDAPLMRFVRTLVDPADIIIAQNGDRFDVPIMHTRFLQHGIPPPRPYMTIDTLKIFKKYFKFDSNKQGWVSEQFGTVPKLATHGEKTWTGFIMGDPKECKIMEEYNKVDVEGLYANFHLVLPWVLWKENRRRAIEVKI